MAWIKTVALPEATGVVAEVYQTEENQLGFVRETTQVLSLKPSLLELLIESRTEAKSSDWKTSPVRREMLAVVCSSLNNCRY